MAFCNRVLFSELPGLRTSDIAGIVSMVSAHRTGTEDPAASEVDPFAYADYAAEQELRAGAGEAAADGLPTPRRLRHLDLPTGSQMARPTKGTALVRLRACVDRWRSSGSYGAYVCNAAEQVDGAERSVLTLFAELSQIPFLQLFHTVTALEEFLLMAAEEPEDDENNDDNEEERELQDEVEEELDEDLYDDEEDGFKKTEMGFHWLPSTKSFDTFRHVEQLQEASQIVPEVLSLILEHRHSLQSVRDAALVPPPPPPPPKRKRGRPSTKQKQLEEQQRQQQRQQQQRWY